MDRPRVAAFTLIEIVIVIIVMASITGFAITKYRQTMDREKFRQARYKALALAGGLRGCMLKKSGAACSTDQDYIDLLMKIRGSDPDFFYYSGIVTHASPPRREYHVHAQWNADPACEIRGLVWEEEVMSGDDLQTFNCPAGY